MKLRTEFSTMPRRVVVKFGSSALTKPGGGVDDDAIARVASEIAWLKQQNMEVVLVSSGAIQAGRGHLQTDQETIDFLQACSAVGQPRLMKTYMRQFQEHSIDVAQILLTHQDFRHRVRHINARNTVLKLLQSGIVPILNENDTVSYREISLGDNDQLAAMAAVMVNADLLIMLTSPDGLFDRAPEDPEAKVVPIVRYGQALPRLKFGNKSQVGRGGMRSKLYAVQRAIPNGVPVIICSHLQPQPLQRALQESCGTFFEPDTSLGPSDRDQWLMATAEFNKALHVDEGAFRAVGRCSASLLASGIVSAKGDFRKGDCVALVYQGNPFAVGLVEYDCDMVNRIAGMKNADIEVLLGPKAKPAVVLGRNMALRR